METVGKTYKHFKGGLYIVVDIARYEPNQQKVVIYRSLKTGELWVRPYVDFFGYKQLEDGEKIRRFSRIQI